MKKTSSFVALAIAALCATAADRFYIEDFTIEPGETRTVSIMLDNETAYTAFQTDLYLPVGLTVEQEDGDYIFDLTSRKGKDHNIASQLQADGAIRIMSYSPSIKAYSGNSGALVTFNVTASDNFGGTKSIELKNTLFTTVSGSEIQLQDDVTQVIAPLLDLTGGIIFTEGGRKNQVMDADSYEIIDFYEYVDICYTGQEDVKFSILVNDVDLFGDEAIEYDISNAAVWNDEINGYRVYLASLRPIGYGDNSWYSAHYHFEVTISADGYCDISRFDQMDYFISGPKPKIEVEDYCDIFARIIRVDTEMSGAAVLVNGVLHQCVWDDDWWEAYYIAERLNEDYEITVRAASKTIGMDFYLLGDEEITITVPALDYSFIIIDQCIGYDNEGHEIFGRNFEVYCDYYSLYSLSVTINGISAEPWNEYYSDNFFDLLPYGDPNGGDYFIQVTAMVDDYYVGEHEVYAEAHLEYYLPTITTILTDDAMIIDVMSELSEIRLKVGGVTMDELPCTVQRMDYDDYIDIEVLLSPDGEKWYSTFDYLLIPARVTSTMQGDVDGNGKVNISDVTALIDYLLNGDASEISLSDADCDGNGAVNISDVTDLIDYLLSDSWPGSAPVTTSYTANGVTFKMVAVDGGSFMMGGTPEQGDEVWDREKPVHEVTLTGFNMGQTEVTQELWQAVMGANPSYHTGDLQRPVDQVSWVDCIEFISNLNQLTGKSFRLPTEAEWEFAARGGNKSEGYRYAGGNDMDAVSWYIDNSDNMTHPVATKAPNELGLYDMTGNVWEWCNDWYHRYTADAQVDPMGQATGTNRVLRGGCWNGGANYNRIAFRDNFTPTGGNNSGGMRLVLDSDNSPKFRLSETVIKVYEGKSMTVNILNGGGTYTVAGGTDYVSPSINGNQLTVTGISSGTTTVYVTDAATGATAVIAVIVTDRYVEEFTVNGVTFAMVSVNGGTFTMGATAEQGSDALDREKPAHQVTLSSYRIGETEVTQELWMAVMGSNPSNFSSRNGYSENLSLPVEHVSWNSCQSFISKLNEMTGEHFRLPTEAEWEFAARGGTRSMGFKYAGSNDIDAVAWYKDNSNSITHTVGSKVPNELGLYDMSGNVWEWCQDWYDDYPSSAQTDPTGPATGTICVYRGGGWSNNASYSRVSSRSGRNPTNVFTNVGLRLALD